MTRWILGTAALVALLAMSGLVQAQTLPTYLTLRVVPADPNAPAYWISPTNSTGFPVADFAACEATKGDPAAQTSLDAIATWLQIPAGTKVFLACQGGAREVTIGGGP